MPEDKEESQGEEEEEEEESEDEEEEKPAAKDAKKADFKPPPRNEKGAESPEKAAGKEAEAPAKPAEVEFKPHDSYPPMKAAAEIVYCPVCSLPPDFCIFGPCWEKCKPWCMENFPEYYPELSGANIDDAKKTAQEAAEKGKEKLLPGGKKRRENSPRVTIRKLTRGGRKCVTSVAGLEGFGVKLDGVAKLFKKKFACGSAVVKGDNGAPDTVDVQGDFEDEIIDIITQEYKDIPREKFSTLESGTKKKGKPK